MPAHRQTDFNAALAQKIAHETSPRDAALHFVGRHDEITKFTNRGLKGCLDREQSIFLIYQGAPGSGKTTFANHLAQTMQDDAVFIKVEPHHLTDRQSPILRVRDGAMTQGGQWGVLAARWAGMAVDRLSKGIASEITEGADNRALEGLRFVLHIDEAHSVNEDALEVLKGLHIGGLGEITPVHSVVILTGLQHTLEHISNYPGLTRVADETAWGMGTLSYEECAESTQNMLDDLCPVNDNRAQTAKDQLANLSATLSLGWPRHLLSAQRAVCEQLVRCGGDLAIADPAQIKQDASARRDAHYQRRLREVKGYKYRRQACHEVLLEVGKGRCEETLEALSILTRDKINIHSTLGGDMEEAKSLALGLIDRGILQQENDLWTLAIPSMADWAQRQIQHQQDRDLGR